LEEGFGASVRRADSTRTCDIIREGATVNADKVHPGLTENPSKSLVM